MSRRIITKQLHAGGAPQPTVDGFVEKLWKYIPADVIAFYVFVAGLIEGSNLSSKQVIYWIVVVVGLAGAFFWTLRRTQLPNVKPAYVQAAIAAASFLVWVFAIGGPFADYSWWNSILGAIVLASFTLLIPLVNPD